MSQPSRRTSAKDLLNYGLLGWALGAVAVPIYIQVPYLYSRIYEVPSAWVGIILLLSRLLDAVLDPAIGLWVDRRSAKDKPGNPGNRYALPLLLSVPLLLLGMAGVFFPLGNNPTKYAASLMASLIVVHLGYSFASIAYQAWGAELGHTDKERSTFVAVREGIGILGVVFAVSLALETNAGLIFTVFALMLVMGMFLLVKFSPQPDRTAQQGARHAVAEPARGANQARAGAAAAIYKGLADIMQPLRKRNFRKLMGVFLCNGLAAALPATLVPFYMRDRLGLGDSDQWVLAVYFLVGAVSTVFWVNLSSKIGLARAWLLGMVISIPAFIAVITLGEGDLTGYLVVCIVTGFALGADLSLPAALVARLIEENGERGKTEGTYFGLWNWVNKFNLALAPSFALGTLQWFNYSADLAKTDTYQNLGWMQQLANDPLLWVYALVPCALKLLAIVLLGRSGLASLNQTTSNNTIGSTT